VVRLLPEIVNAENRLIARKLLIISVGSSASIHLLRGIAAKEPSILFENEFIIIETSEDMFNIAVETLTATYRSYYGHKVGEEPEKFKGFPTSTFKHKLIQNGILLAKGGGATTPELGLKYYTEKRNFTLTRISKVFREYNCNGIVVLGCVGKGTATLVTPALINDIFTNKGVDLPHPLGFIALPFRFRRTDAINAKKTIEYIVDNSVPVFLLDYEHALDIFLYLTKERPKRPTVSTVYQSVVGGLAYVLSALIDALNYGQYCSPPIDWSDLMPLFEMKGAVGTLAFSYHTREDEMLRKWKADLDRLLMLRNKSKPSRTSAITIVRSGSGIPLELTENLSEYYARSWKTERHEIYTLERGEGYTIATLLYGFDPLKIDPEVRHKSYSLLDRIKRGIAG